MKSVFTKKSFIRAASAGVLVIAVLSAGILAGCGTNNSQNSTNTSTQQNASSTENPETSESSAENPVDRQSKIMEDYNALLADNTPLPEVVKFIDKNIPLVSNENAAVILDGFEEVQKKLLSKLDEKFYNGEGIQTEISKVYKSNFDINKIDSIENTELKALLTETRDSGYKVETAEGMFFPVINYEFYKKYSTYATPDIKEYIDLMAVESNKIPAKDAALVISWDEILKRALNQEKFITQYGNSIKIQEVKDLYRKYLTFSLLGANNTPLFSYDSKAMVQEAKEAYLNAAGGNKDSGFLKLISSFMDLLKKTNYKLTDEVDKYRKGVIENLK
jgi:hypothetical protein